MEKTYYVYMITNDSHSTIYTGITNDLRRRLLEHRKKINPSFTTKYRTYKLAYFEAFGHPSVAIAREKQIKKGSRLKKIKLIESKNKGWEDLSSLFL